MTAFVEKTYEGRTFRVVDTSTYEYGSYEFEDELDVKAAYWSGIKPTETVIDIGASWGGYALPALAHGAKVIAFEPSDRGHRVLVDAVIQNGFLYRAVCLKTALYDGGDFPEWFYQHIFKGFFIPETAQTERLDDVIGRIIETGFCDRIDRIKMDVEGAEMGILRGAEKTLRAYMPALAIEDHTTHEFPGLADNDVQVMSFLRDLGYCNVQKIQPTKGNPFVIASK